MTNKEQLELIGYCPVDSGLMMLSDPCYILDEGPRPNKYSKEILDSLENEQSIRILNDSAVVCSTAYGDGTYPVYVTKNQEGRISSMTIDFDNVYGDPEDYE